MHDDGSGVEASGKMPRDERWSRYPETVLIFSGPPELMIDLRETISPATKNALASLGFGEPFSVITAFNPKGVDTSEDENARRMREMEQELRSSGDEFVSVDACSPDKSHCECSVAVKGSRERALDIARRWEQIAIFWWDGARFWIYGAISDTEPMELPITGP